MEPLEQYLQEIRAQLTTELGPSGYTIFDLRPESTDLAPKKVFVFSEELQTPQEYADNAQSCQFRVVVFVATCFDPRANNSGVSSVRARVMKALTRAIVPVSALGAMLTLDGDQFLDAEGVTVASAPVTLEWSEDV